MIQQHFTVQACLAHISPAGLTQLIEWRSGTCGARLLQKILTRSHCSSITTLVSWYGKGLSAGFFLLPSTVISPLFTGCGLRWRNRSRSGLSIGQSLGRSLSLTRHWIREWGRTRHCLGCTTRSQCSDDLVRH